eukprot:124649_1
MAQKEEQIVCEKITNCALNDCVNFKHLYNKMKHYCTLINHNNDMKNIFDIDNNNLVSTLNDFLHVLQIHNSTDEEYQTVTNKLGFCDINTCQIIQRNYRNRNKFKTNNKARTILYRINNDKIDNIFSENDIWRYQIFDKIHCFYYHSVDIGNRLSIKDKANINIMTQNMINDSLINNKIIKMNELLSNKQKNCKYSDGLKRRYVKFNQLFKNENEQKQDQKDNIMETKSDEIYSFGSEFLYGYNDEIGTSNGIPIKPKYHSLKQELTTNDISILSIDQFNNEKRKAQIHFDSNYRKQNYKQMKVYNILSLMIYCNFDVLQFEFSKTYRENINQHNNFYYFG